MSFNVRNLAPQLTVFEETAVATEPWKKHDSLDVNIFQQKPKSTFVIFATAQFKDLEQYQSNKHWFHGDFETVVQDDINGSFHCEYTVDRGIVHPQVSWSCFKIKNVKAATDYEWKQPTIYMDWDPQTKRQLVFIIDFLDFESKQKEFLQGLPARDDRSENPFFWHTAFARVVVAQYDDAFWMLRNQVRELEKKRSDASNPPPNFPLLHDIARHVFHYVETIEVAEHTLQGLVAEQTRWRKEKEDQMKWRKEQDPEDNIRKILPLWLKTHRQLLFQEKGIHSLKTRARSLNDRHLNEINLAFNLVSQRFGRDAQSDSAMMKTIAVVSMFYLPGTFVSGLYGTNFFGFNASTIGMSPDFWKYWAVTIPLTLFTVFIWALWHYRGLLMKGFNKVTGQQPETPKPVDPRGMPMGALNRILTRTMTTGFGRRVPKRHESV